MRPLRMEEGQVGMTRVKIKGQCIGKLPCFFNGLRLGKERRSRTV